MSSSIHHITLERDCKGLRSEEPCIGHQQEVFKLLKENLFIAQNRMKQQLNQHQNEREFEVGDWVF